MLTCEDYCGALEVLAMLDDAELELTIIGIDRRIKYLEYLLTICYDIPVLRFLLAMLEWLTGDHEWRKQLMARLSRLAVETSKVPALRRPPWVLIEQRPPPKRERPCIAPTGPPLMSGVTKQSALVAA